MNELDELQNEIAITREMNKIDELQNEIARIRDEIYLANKRLDELCDELQAELIQHIQGQNDNQRV